MKIMKIMKIMKVVKEISVLLFIALVSISINSGCTKTINATNQKEGQSKAISSDNGKKVKFPEGSTSLNLIKMQTVSLGKVLISVKAPSRVVATISSAVSSKEKIILFDSPDVTSLYSQYRQTKANLNLFTENLKRIRDMFENHGATAKDVNQAENDLSLAKASFSELEGKLRSSGFNPIELENASESTVWLLSDVPESQLNEVQNREAVDVYFNSFPDKKLEGHVTAIGDVVDPITRTIKVRVKMNNYMGKLIPGMFASVDYGDPISGVIKLPATCVVSVDGIDYVFIEKSPGEFERREVTIKKSATDDVVISHGLSNGEKIVINGTILLKGISFGY
jgi:hypothetical protein